MNMQRLVVLGLCLAPVILYASGSYTARPPRPPAVIEMAKDADKQRYELGKKIYSGKARLSGRPSLENMADQETRLKALQARLPESAQKKTDLPVLAGRLSPAELDALEYYVNKRFPVK